MLTYLLSDNAKYVKYWSKIIQDTTALNQDKYMTIKNTDILIVDNKLYDSLPNIEAKMIVLDNEPNLKRCIELLDNGVKAYGNTYMHSSHILSAIQSLKDNKIWIYPEFLAAMIGMTNKNTEDILEEKIELLTPREKEIAKLILKGFTNKEIAIELKIFTNTIKNHTKNIYRKLDVTDRLSLFSYLK